MQKFVLALLDLHDDPKCKKKAMKIVSSVAGIESISLDMKEGKVTLVGKMDLMQVVNKLRRTFHTEILTVGPADDSKKTPPAVDPPPITYVPWTHHNPFFPNHVYYY